MVLARPVARLSTDRLTVEAGSSVETTIAVPSTAVSAGEGFELHAVRVANLPSGWYSLAATTVRVPAGGWGELLLVLHPPYDEPAENLGERLFSVVLTAGADGGTVELPARLVVLPPGGVARHSRLLAYLPALYRNDPFMGRFLLIFQSILDPIVDMIDDAHFHLDPELTPRRFLTWLASWVDVALEPGLDEATQRRLIRRAVELYRWKGTRRALREELEIRTGGRALIVENFDGLRLGQDGALGLNTQLGVRRDNSITVTLASDAADVDARTGGQEGAYGLVRDLKPAHVGHVVRLVAAPGGPRGGRDG